MLCCLREIIDTLKMTRVNCTIFSKYVSVYFPIKEWFYATLIDLTGKNEVTGKKQSGSMDGVNIYSM